MFEKIKSFLKEDINPEQIQGIITKYTEDLKQASNPLTGLDVNNAWDFVNKQPVLKSAFDSKVTEALKKNWDTHFDQKYKERYNTEHPPKTETEKRLVELERKDQEREKVLKRSRIKDTIMDTLADMKIIDESKVIVDLLISDTEEQAQQNVKLFLAYRESLLKSSQEKFLKDNSLNPGTGAGVPATTKEQLVSQYNDAIKNRNMALAIDLQSRIQKMRG